MMNPGIASTTTAAVTQIQAGTRFLATGGVAGAAAIGVLDETGVTGAGVCGTGVSTVAWSLGRDIEMGLMGTLSRGFFGFALRAMAINWVRTMSSVAGAGCPREMMAA